MNYISKFFTVFGIIFSVINPAVAQILTLDDFETKNGWEFIQSDGVNLSLSIDKGMTGNAVRFDYDFSKGTGYGGIQKFFPMNLPENFEFTFYLKAQSPENNFEIKFIDSSGDNVWWVNNRNYDFPGDWKKIRVKKRHISFAWGPAENHELKNIDRIEFTVASFVGGKGTIWIDELKFEPLPAELQSYPPEILIASSSEKGKTPNLMTDGKLETFWQAKSNSPQEIIVDFSLRREFGGLHIVWSKGLSARNFEVFTSDDGTDWEKIYTVTGNLTNASFLRMPESEAKYMKICLLQANNEEGYDIAELKFLEVKNTLTMNDFLIYVAKNSPKGDYPRYFLEQASYWTVSGVNNDSKEALINNDGMIEVDKALFSIEPIIKRGNTIYNWNNVKSSQSMSLQDNPQELDYAPSVVWEFDGLKFATRIISSGEANINSRLNIRYSIENLSSKHEEIELYLLIRPYQVNPYYQFLNLSGGAGKISSLREENPGEIAVDDKVVFFTEKYDLFVAATSDNGNITDLIRSGMLHESKSAVDQNRQATGFVKYSISLNPTEKRDFYIVVPFHTNDLHINLTKNAVAEEFLQVSDWWKQRLSHIRFNLPPSADRILAAYKANLFYILINRDYVGIQPGSRSYERSWIRDGSLTSSALLKSGIVEEVRDFTEWYAGYQFENGKVPCVVDFRGPDPVPEHDSHGQLIYLIREYFNFTHDTIFLRSMNQHVLKSVEYIESLIAERSTDAYKNGNDSIRAYYGIVPESISHEGYSAKPMHSYWDNFFIMKGLKDAVEIQKILGETSHEKNITGIRDDFRKNLYQSIDLAMKTRNIDFIPGCVELGDFDPTSTTIALTPCNELKNLPKPQVYNTFEKYYEFFQERRDGKLGWINYTPYENRLIGSFILLDQPERAHELINFFLNDQRPQGWHHWAEVVWKDKSHPGFIGDMPHTWVGSDFINAVRSMFVYENEYDESLVLAPALYQEWIDYPEGISVENLPTYYGDISFSIRKVEDFYRFIIDGDLSLPVNGIQIRNFNHSKKPAKVTVNGIDIKEFSNKEINVKAIPAEVMIFY
ncbi:MAG TPA: discoidin domain-containing protein [Bacteroidales bacterium]|nr:discoidin domain-containing protein [Bacteroidales bacterium]